jgi:hypothetical protein
MLKRKHNHIVDPAYIRPNNYIGQLYAIKDRGDILFRGYSTDGPLLGWVKEEDVYFIRDMDGPLYAQVIDDDIIFRSRSKIGRIVIMLEIPFWNRVTHRFSQNNVHYDEY